jgi:hypothetical protein
MHGREFKKLVEDAKVVRAHGTPHEQAQLLQELIKLLDEA